jgi:hypothetical protein
MSSKARYLSKDARYKGRKDEEEDVRDYWGTLKKEKTLEFDEKALDCAVWRTRFGRGY